ncbi:MAG: hypothetical protein JKY60_11140 [Kordiimonadaceae bacterium]|nr:hypothetical protein [Kordiimonadaceae bacterium]
MKSADIIICGDRPVKNGFVASCKNGRAALAATAFFFCNVTESNVEALSTITLHNKTFKDAFDDYHMRYSYKLLLEGGLT